MAAVAPHTRNFAERYVYFKHNYIAKGLAQVWNPTCTQLEYRTITFIIQNVSEQLICQVCARF